MLKSLQLINPSIEAAWRKRLRRSLAWLLWLLGALLAGPSLPDLPASSRGPGRVLLIDATRLRQVSFETAATLLERYSAMRYGGIGDESEVARAIDDEAVAIRARADDRSAAASRRTVGP